MRHATAFLKRVRLTLRGHNAPSRGEARARPGLSSGPYIRKKARS